MEKYLLSLSLLSSLSAGQLLAVPAYAGPHHQNDAMGPLLFDLIETAQFPISIIWWEPTSRSKVKSIQTGGAIITRGPQVLKSHPMIIIAAIMADIIGTASQGALTCACKSTQGRGLTLLLRLVTRGNHFQNISQCTRGEIGRLQFNQKSTFFCRGKNRSFA